MEVFGLHRATLGVPPTVGGRILRKRETGARPSKDEEIHAVLEPLEQALREELPREFIQALFVSDKGAHGYTRSGWISSRALVRFMIDEVV